MSCLVAPYAGSVTCWGISEWGEDLHKLLLGNDSGLRESVHAAAYFTEEVAVADEVVKLVFVHDLF